METQIIDVDFDDGFKSIAKIVKDSYNEYEVALLEPRLMQDYLKGKKQYLLNVCWLIVGMIVTWVL